MILTVTIMVALTVAIAARLHARPIGKSPAASRGIPDRPVGFGRSMAWLAVRSRDTHAVAEALDLVASVPCNWRAGIAAVYDERLGNDHVYVSPPVNGWTFVVGLSLPHPVGRAFTDKSFPLLQALARRFVEVQYFFAYPPIDLFAWARFIEGRCLRAFAIGDSGVVWNRGRSSREERALGLRLFEFRGVRGRNGDAGGEMILYPTEDHILRLAQRWSIDPTCLGERDAPTLSLGLIALAPAAWRPEILRRAG